MRALHCTYIVTLCCVVTVMLCCAVVTIMQPGNEDRVIDSSNLSVLRACMPMAV